MITDATIALLANSIASGSNVDLSKLPTGARHAVVREANRLTKQFNRTKIERDLMSTITSRNKALATYLQLSAERKSYDAKSRATKKKEDAALAVVLGNPSFTESTVKIDGVTKYARANDETRFRLVDHPDTFMNLLNIAVEVQMDTIVERRIAQKVVPDLILLDPAADELFDKEAYRVLSLTKD